ncbi:hypothetical protein V3331_18015 [Gaopeijia maritima]|uniref:hypothetical protein n=1 Tax=Gaopeijia maritima TaxID=3119007 RepID=UPI00324C2677
MNGSARLVSTLALAFGLAGCAGTSPPADIDPAPAPAPPDEVPLRWYVDAYGPYDTTRVGPSESGPGSRPLFLVDGVQPDPVEHDVGALMRESVQFLQARKFDPSGRIRDVIIYRHRCDLAQFGPAGEYGAILMFRSDYDGPTPEPAHSRDTRVCRGEG